jgi:predicted O-methyltransferase YrrM
VVTLEADNGKIALARENLRRAGCADRLDLVAGRASCWAA